MAQRLSPVWLRAQARDDAITDSQRTGNLTGNFANFEAFLAISALADAKEQLNLKGLRAIPCTFRNRDFG
jgi:hypothetical protein